MEQFLIEVVRSVLVDSLSEIVSLAIASLFYALVVKKHNK